MIAVGIAILLGEKYGSKLQKHIGKRMKERAAAAKIKWEEDMIRKQEEKIKQRWLR